MVQFHAVALLHAVRATDRLAISKLVTTLTKSNVKSPMAQVLLVRYVAQVRSVHGRGWDPGSMAVSHSHWVVAVCMGGGNHAVWPACDAQLRTTGAGHLMLAQFCQGSL